MQWFLSLLLFLVATIPANAAAQEAISLNFYFKMNRPVQVYFDSVEELSLAAEVSAVNPELGAKVRALAFSDEFRKAYSQKLLDALNGPPENLRSRYPETILIELMAGRYPECAQIFANGNRAMAQAAVKVQMRAFIHDAPNGFARLRAREQKPNQWAGSMLGSPLGASYIDFDPQTATATLYCVPYIDGMSREEIVALYGRLRTVFMDSLVGWQGGKVYKDSSLSSGVGLNSELNITFEEGTQMKMVVVNHDHSGPTYLTIEVISPKLQTAR